jgi:hypothetical protein
MLRYFPMLLVAVPLCGHCQSYASSSFYSPVSAIPSGTHIEGYAPGSLKANDVVIDLSESVPGSSPDFGEIAGWSVGADTDGNKPAQLLHFYIQYDHLNIAFAYDLLAEPIAGTDRIKCTFSAFTDPQGRMHNNKEIIPVALPAALTPLVVRSGDVISIPTLPLGEGRIAAVHYLRLTRTDLMPSSTQ